MYEKELVFELVQIDNIVEISVKFDVPSNNLKENIPCWNGMQS